MSNESSESSWLTAEQHRRVLRVVSAPIYRATHDKNGRSETLSIRVIPAHARRLSELAQNPESPYRTLSDVVRHHVWMGLQLEAARSSATDADRDLDQLRGEMEDLRCTAQTVRDLLLEAKNYEEMGLSKLANRVRKRVQKDIQKMPEPKREYALAVWTEITGENSNDQTDKPG